MSILSGGLVKTEKPGPLRRRGRLGVSSEFWEEAVLRKVRVPLIPSALNINGHLLKPKTVTPFLTCSILSSMSEEIKKCPKGLTQRSIESVKLL